MKMKEEKSVKRGKKNKKRQQKNKREARGRMGGGLNTREGVNVGG